MLFFDIIFGVFEAADIQQPYAFFDLADGRDPDFLIKGYQAFNRRISGL